jgi:hypothetical protein
LLLAWVAAGVGCCWRGLLLAWVAAGVGLQAWRELLAARTTTNGWTWDETLLDGSFVSAKKGALASTLSI